MRVDTASRTDRVVGHLGVLFRTARPTPLGPHDFQGRITERAASTADSSNTAVLSDETDRTFRKVP